MGRTPCAGKPSDGVRRPAGSVTRKRICFSARKSERETKKKGRGGEDGREDDLIPQRIPREGEPRRTAFGVVSRTWPGFRPLPLSPSLPLAPPVFRPSADPAAFASFEP